MLVQHVQIGTGAAAGKIVIGDGDKDVLMEQQL